jgi:cellulose synthase/poly-beta-1,6-N-acetylglucosamine synthase-like glycosyltransferase
VSIITTSFYSLWLLLAAIYTLAFALFVSTRSPDTFQNDPEYFPTVSLVIPTFNEAQIITQKLENVGQLDYPRDKLEVIVVDGGSTDSTADSVRKFADSNRGRIRIILKEQPTRVGKSAAIDDALRCSESEVFALTDADVIVRPDGLSRLVKHLRDDNVGGASGVEVPVGDLNLMSSIEAGYKSIYAATRVSEANLDTPFMCESEFSAFARDSLERLKPGSMCDDLELTVMIRSRNKRAVYALDAPFFEREASSFTPKLLHKFRRGMANQHGIIRNRKVLFNRNFGKYGTLVFPFEFFVHIVSPLFLVATVILFFGSVLLAATQVPIEIMVVAVSGVPSLILVRRLSRKYSSPEISQTQGKLSWLLGAVAFLGFQIVLAASLVRLALLGPKLRWSQIAETRTPMQMEIKVVSG